MTDYEKYIKEKQEKEEYENSIPTECRQCTLLERDYIHKTIKCLYRENNKCMLKAYMEGDKRK